MTAAHIAAIVAAAGKTAPVAGILARASRKSGVRLSGSFESIHAQETSSINPESS